LLATVLALGFCTPTALARKWTDITGKYAVEVEFVDWKDEDVRLPWRSDKPQCCRFFQAARA